MQDIAELERKPDELPLLPTVVARLLALRSHDDDYFDQILILAQEDPPFALRLIKLANSAFSAPAEAITSLEGAIVRLGSQHIANLSTSMAVTRVFLPTTQGERNLWAHSIQAAVAARIIANLNEDLKVQPDQAYLCGLVHDIGRFILFQDAADDLAHVEESNWSTLEQLIDTEQEVFGFNHAELGWLACNKWCLPELVSIVVKNHHAYKSSKQSSTDTSLENLIRVVQIADSCSVFLLLNADCCSWEANILEEKLEKFCTHPSYPKALIPIKQLQQKIPAIMKESANIVSGLGIG
ncbi:MAG: HDOD domain-containing protein [Gammaproteobacteria bacterium]|jgi:putative nucleotidyltransferase with HDIG domain|nr:hypothetical protein [Chromatiales bacterium]MDP6414560.1 HDOD domain-containing protein [Gammaproteobacteria bacterium]MDP6673707.1 HDOD domain-containing protein [Gammaproteobacteria bacterium]